MWTSLLASLLVGVVIGQLWRSWRKTTAHTGVPELDVCRGYLSDLEYLEHMIPHHQVAVDISVSHQKKSRSPVLQQVMRELVWTQKREIAMMHELKRTAGSEHGMSDRDGMQLGYDPITVGDLVKPNEIGLTKTYCDPHFFNPHAHAEHMKDVDVTDIVYIKHMIPHHQVAVDMSKVLLANTSNDHMIDMAHRIIRSQQEEIALLHSLLAKHNYNMESDLLA